MWSKQNDFWSPMCNAERDFLRWNPPSTLRRVKSQYMALFRVGTQIKFLRTQACAEPWKNPFNSAFTNSGKRRPVSRAPLRRPGNIAAACFWRVFAVHARKRTPVFNNRPLHGFRRHLGCGAVAAKITANVWKILQLSTLVTPQVHVGFWRKMCL